MFRRPALLGSRLECVVTRRWVGRDALEACGDSDRQDETPAPTGTSHASAVGSSRSPIEDSGNGNDTATASLVKVPSFEEVVRRQSNVLLAGGTIGRWPLDSESASKGWCASSTHGNLPGGRWSQGTHNSL